MDPEVIEVEVDEVVTSTGKTKTKKQAAPEQEQASMPKMNLRTRITLKMLQLAANPKTARFFKKAWWPLWAVVGVFVVALGIVFGIVFLIWKFLVALARPYMELFSRKS
ncbi:hypothetical protein Rhal01_01821 [Rubritalea halochordaticola]|uniref:Uncharacterized protein n=1 Tax=Rubritalea halochordaticola TaxID=714537 RepID=A0ABP9UZ46_9BACT